MQMTGFIEFPDPSDTVEIEHTDGTTHTAEAFKIDWNHPRMKGFRVIKKGYSRREHRLTSEQLAVIAHGA